MTRQPPSLSSRARGAFRGALAGASGAATPLVLLRVLAEELAEGRVDLRVVAERWVEGYRADPRGVDAETAAALDFLGRHHAPPTDSAARGPGPSARVIPIALLAFDSPRNLVSATFHTAALTHPDPRSAWAAVAVNVALATFIQGKRDFVPAVLEVLRGNGVPEELLAAVRRVPLRRRQGLPDPALVGIDAVAAAETVLWLAYHEPLPARGLDALGRSGEEGRAVAIAAGALMGARDGAGALPAKLLPGEPALSDWDALADRLVRVAAPV
jgi:ADP-ribosyl-[dinitrogen reductase] hydrolase